VIDNYRNLLYNPYIAAERGYIDGVIMPSETRVRLIDSFRVVSNKRQALPPKKHGNIPQ
jgi:acetyl-CoA carboxylase carboxyltransferase component